MRGYVGQTRSGALIEKLRDMRVGEATQPDEFPPRRLPYFLDNGAFKLWQNGLPFNEERFLRVIERVKEEGPMPDFVVAPDRVANPTSLEYSLSWLPKLLGVAPVALAVQDGMTVEQIRPVISKGFDCIFVGGSLEWKFATAPQWCALAKELGIPCHIGRIGTRPRAKWAREIGASSVDSCVPLFSDGNLLRWHEGMTGEYQSSLFGPPPPKAREAKIVRKIKVKGEIP